MVTTLIARLEDKERTMVRGLFMLSICLIGLYGYFLASSVADALMHKEFERSSARIGTTVSSTEAQYMKMAADIKRDRAANLGLVDAPTPRFLSKNAPATGLTLNR